MTQEHYRHIKEIFQDAIDLPLEERPAYLDSACGSDHGMRAEVESLLAAHEAKGTQLMDEPLAKLAPDLGKQEAQDVPGKRIGPYRIERLLGEGGMGVVYEASRADDQFRQRVALKLVRSAAYSEAVLRRFRQERQILAMLAHPHIARLLDGGVTEQGQPYFVMEYVEGKPISDYCHEKRLGVRERLLLFRDVCAAVQDAHRNLIVHCDLKPSNILVTPDGQVKLLDFGIGKLLREEEETAGPLTMTGMRPMTPEYASPEQVRGASVTTATDVYLLGIVLYELLTGTRPFRLKERLQVEIERIICEEEPARPSTAFTHAGGTSTISNAKPERLRRTLAGDLDNIVLLALRKEPVRRYVSVEQFSGDIQNYLDGLPVLAQMPTLSYRSMKFVRRHRAAVVAAGLIVVAVGSGTVSTALQARVAARERNKAVMRFNQVRQLAHAFLFDFNDALQSPSGLTSARKLIVGKGLQYLDTLAVEAGNDLPLIRELGSGYIRLGDVQGNPVVANLGDPQGAIASYRKAVAILQPISVKGGYESRSELAVAITRFGDLLWATGNGNEALAQYQSALKLQEQLVSERPSDTLQRARSGYNRNNIGDLFLELNDLDQAESSYGRGLEVSKRATTEKPRDPQARLDLSMSNMKLGDIAWYRGNWEKALIHYSAGTEIREALLSEYPDNAKLRRYLLASYNSIGDTRAKRKDIAGAVAEYRKSLRIADALVREDSANQQAQRDRFICLVNLSELLEKQGNFREAAEKARLQMEIASSMVNRGTSPSRVMLEDLANAQERLGNIAMRSGHLEESWKLHSASADIRERTLSMGPTAEGRRNLCSSYLTLGSLARRIAAAGDGSTNGRTEWLKRARASIARATAMGGQIRQQTGLTAIDREVLEQLDSAARVNTEHLGR